MNRPSNNAFLWPSAKTVMRAAVICVFMILAIAFAYWPGSISGVPMLNPGRSVRASAIGPEQPPQRKYSKFSHTVKAHALECSSCHKFPSDNWNKVRAEADAFPDVTEYPKHPSCVGCHRQQFFKGSPPEICSICHLNPSPRDSSRHPFPNPRELFDASKKGKTAVSAFSIFFPHDKHIEIVTGLRRSDRFFENASFRRPGRRMQTEESCSVCHRTYLPQGDSDTEFITPPPKDIGDGFWLKKGTFKTTPIGHTTCFTCHSQDTGILPEPQTCSACHKLTVGAVAADFDADSAAKMGITDKILLTSWRKRDSSGKFQHEWFAHSELSCSTCHNVTEIITTEPQTKKVKIDSCAMCHVTATSDDGGAVNFEIDSRKSDSTFQCVKCHINFGKMAVPQSHSDALTAAGN